MELVTVVANIVSWFLGSSTHLTQHYFILDFSFGPLVFFIPVASSMAGAFSSAIL